MLRRDTTGLTEFLMFTLWDSLDSVKAFAGQDYETAVFYPEDDRFLVERDEFSAHYFVHTHIAPPDRDEVRVLGRDRETTCRCSTRTTSISWPVSAPTRPESQVAIAPPA